MVALLRRARNPARCGTRSVYLIDSGAVCAALAKGRSPSWLLNEELRRASAIRLAMGSRDFFVWVASKANPSDGPSRELHVYTPGTEVSPDAVPTLKAHAPDLAPPQATAPSTNSDADPPLPEGHSPLPSADAAVLSVVASPTSVEEPCSEPAPVGCGDESTELHAQDSTATTTTTTPTTIVVGSGRSGKKRGNAHFGSEEDRVVGRRTGRVLSAASAPVPQEGEGPELDMPAVARGTTPSAASTAPATSLPRTLAEAPSSFAVRGPKGAGRRKMNFLVVSSERQHPLVDSFKKHGHEALLVNPTVVPQCFENAFQKGHWETMVICSVMKREWDGVVLDLPLTAWGPRGFGEERRLRSSDCGFAGGMIRVIKACLRCRTQVLYLTSPRSRLPEVSFLRYHRTLGYLVTSHVDQYASGAPWRGPKHFHFSYGTLEFDQNCPGGHAHAVCPHSTNQQTSSWWPPFSDRVAGSMISGIVERRVSFPRGI